MEKQEYLTAYRSDLDALLAAARLGLDAQVPGCPDWNVGQLAGHLAGLYMYSDKRLRSPVGNTSVRPEDLAAYPGLAESRAHPESRDAVPPNVLAYLEDIGARLEEAMTAVDASQRVDTWFPPDQTAGFVQRRVAQETTIHRWDAQDAHGISTPIEPELARDGIDEVLHVMLQARYNRARPFRQATGERFHFHRTDGDGEWLVRFHADDIQVTREHSKGDVAFRGSASDLLLFLWGRLPADRLEVIGEPEMVRRWLELASPG